MSTRLNVNINDATRDAIREIQAHRQTTATDVVRRAVSVLALFEAAWRRGDRVEIHDAATGEIREVRFP